MCSLAIIVQEKGHNAWNDEYTDSDIDYIYDGREK
jgi:hypothetical protein